MDVKVTLKNIEGFESFLFQGPDLIPLRILFHCALYLTSHWNKKIERTEVTSLLDESGWLSHMRNYLVSWLSFLKRQSILLESVQICY